VTAEEYGARFFASGSTMPGLVTVPGKLSDDEAKRLQGMFTKRHAGTKNAHAIGVLSGGAQWTQISVTPEQAQFLETRRFTRTDIALFFRVPPYKVDP